MITIVAHMQCAPDTEAEILDATQWFIPATRAEPGCLEFYLHRQLDDPARFVWYENFVDQVAVDAHVASAHVARWFELIRRLGAQNTYALYARVGEE
jgi:quinol monooxygenase YgiN